VIAPALPPALHLKGVEPPGLHPPLLRLGAVRWPGFDFFHGGIVHVEDRHTRGSRMHPSPVLQPAS
jgi:hypothetical protein